jgi:uncharacterized protein (DUF433 family)
MDSDVTRSHTERIVATPGICGGDWRIRDTRVTVRVLTQSRELGIDDSELLEDYPFLTAHDLKEVWQFVAKR